MNMNTFNTPTVIEAARKYWKLKKELDRIIDTDPENDDRVDEAADLFFEAEENMMEEAMKRLRLVGTKEQIVLIEKFKTEQRMVQKVAQLALA